MTSHKPDVRRPDDVAQRIGARRVGFVMAAVAIVLFGFSAQASAHPISTTAILLDIGTRSANATIELPLDELGVALNRQLTADSVVDPATLAEIRSYIGDHLSVTDAQRRTWRSRVSGGHVAAIDGVEQLVLDAVLAPDTGVMSAFQLHYDAIINRVASHRVFVSAREGTTGDYTTLVMLSWQRTSVPVTASGPSTSSEFSAAVELGIEHIRSGSDHLLFITMLLLPAPLVVAGSKWRRSPDQRGAARRLVHVVTAFTIGHSLTLALGAFGLLHLPSRVVESGIALSVPLSAVHAIRPPARRGEVLIAGSFGLLHGLAFASALQQLDLGRAALIENLLGFNVGIELTQLCVLALVLPSLVILSRTILYPAFRVGAAFIGGSLATGWLMQRIGLISSNPLERVADLVVNHPFALAVGTAAIAVVSVSSPRLRVSAAQPTSLRRDSVAPAAMHLSFHDRHANVAVEDMSWTTSRGDHTVSLADVPQVKVGQNDKVPAHGTTTPITSEAVGKHVDVDHERPHLWSTRRRRRSFPTPANIHRIEQGHRQLHFCAGGCETGTSPPQSCSPLPSCLVRAVVARDPVAFDAVALVASKRQHCPDALSVAFRRIPTLAVAAHDP